MNTPTRYLVPRPRGASWAVSSRQDDPERRIILTLMGKAGEQPMDLDALAGSAGMAPGAAFGKFVFGLQRRGYLTCDTAPLSLPKPPTFADAINDCLARLALSGTAILANEHGLAYGRAGASVTDANLMASMAWRMFEMRERLRRSMSRHPSSEHMNLTGAYVIEDLQLMPIDTGKRRFHLVTLGQPEFTNGAYVALIALLIRRYQ